MMYTSGPWTHSPQIGDDKACFRALVLGVDGRTVATLEITNDERVATDYARLFAAAPEMLDVLKLARVMLDAMIAASNGNIHDHCISTVCRIDEVIRKVTVTDADQTSARGDK